MRRNRQTPHRAAGISKARSLDELSEYWDTHELLPRPGRRTVQAPVILHVTSAGARGWKVESDEGSIRAEICAAKRDAADRAKHIAQSHPCGIVVIHRADGSVEAERRYGSFPRPGDRVEMEIDIQRVRHYVAVKPALMKRALREARKKGVSTEELIDSWVEIGARGGP
jgi:hypothetical protein